MQSADTKLHRLEGRVSINQLISFPLRDRLYIMQNLHIARYMYTCTMYMYHAYMYMHHVYIYIYVPLYNCSYSYTNPV